MRLAPSHNCILQSIRVLFVCQVARVERERRRRKVLVDQQAAAVEAEEKRKQQRLLDMLQRQSSAERAMAERGQWTV